MGINSNLPAPAPLRGGWQEWIAENQTALAGALTSLALVVVVHLGALNTPRTLADVTAVVNLVIFTLVNTRTTSIKAAERRIVSALGTPADVGREVAGLMGYLTPPPSTPVTPLPSTGSIASTVAPVTTTTSAAGTTTVTWTPPPTVPDPVVQVAPVAPPPPPPPPPAPPQQVPTIAGTNVPIVPSDNGNVMAPVPSPAPLVARTSVPDGTPRPGATTSPVIGPPPDAAPVPITAPSGDPVGPTAPPVTPPSA